MTPIAWNSSWLEVVALPFVTDLALKCAGILLVAALVSMALSRASAAARHLVWLLALGSVVALPLLSALLPEWRALPSWASSVLADGPTPVMPNAPGTPESLADPGPDGPTPATPIASTATAAPASVAPVPSISGGTPSAPSTLGAFSWQACLLVSWAAGCGLLLARLAVAHLVLLRTSNACERVDRGPLTDAFADACRQVGVRRCTLLIDPGRRIPVVWGVLRPRLVLPAEATGWDAAQLHSVLLHELAHVRRGDLVAHWIAQVACALHWFDPLAWLAARRLHIERERACDDLVLASGVRASEYAGHLLDIASRLGPIRWTAACGLAMARASRLEGRLIAVLSDGRARARVSGALAAATVLLAAALVVPLAMLRAVGAERLGTAFGAPSEADDGAADPPSEGGPDAAERPASPGAAAAEPAHEYSRALWRKWQRFARTDGRIPGALVGELAAQVDDFTKSSGDEALREKLAPIRARMDASRDLPAADAVALLDAIAAVATAPVSWADLKLEFSGFRNLKPGEPLPPELAGAAWGAPAENGLRAAWMLDPSAETYRVGSVLKARVLFYNAGKEPVVFTTETYHQFDAWDAKDGRGNAIKVSTTWYSGVTPTVSYRLAPGEYAEVAGHGVAIGAGAYEEERGLGQVGAVVEAKWSDEVRLSWTVDAKADGWREPDEPKDEDGRRRRLVANRVAREGPMPEATADRILLVRRASLDLVGTLPTPEEVAEFVEDDAPGALDRLAERLAAKPAVKPWSGALPTGEVTFSVMPPDPAATEKPGFATRPGRYILAERVHLLVSRTTTDAGHTNAATIVFLSPDPKVASPHAPHEITLPDGRGGFSFSWKRGAGVLWLSQKDALRRFDYRTPGSVREDRFQPPQRGEFPSQRDILEERFPLRPLEPKPPR